MVISQPHVNVLDLEGACSSPLFSVSDRWLSWYASMQYNDLLTGHLRRKVQRSCCACSEFVVSNSYRPGYQTSCSHLRTPSRGCYLYFLGCTIPILTSSTSIVSRSNSTNCPVSLNLGTLISLTL